MKKTYLIAIALLFSVSAFGQEEKISDTTRMNLGNKEFIIIEHENDEIDFEDSLCENHKKRSEAHWAGLDFGFTMLMNSNFENKFPDNPYWNNDAARSQVWNLNLLEHKFNIAKQYVGLTTGLGFSFTSVAINHNYVIGIDGDSLSAYADTVYSYSKNKLKAAYLTVPLLLEFNTNKDPEKSFYLAAGVVGGVRIASRIKRRGEFDGKEFVEKEKGKFGLSPFKVDATVRLGYSNWGAFASYSLLPLFDSGITADVYPFTFGLSLNF